MVYTSDRPVLVDGVRLDTLAWNIEKIRRSVAARREANVDVPGRDGVIASLNDTLEPASIGLDMFVRGTDEDGLVPGGTTSRDKMWANLDELVHLFGTRHRLLEVTEYVTATQQRRAFAKVTDTIAPDLNLSGSAGTFTVGLEIPSGTWEDVNTSDWTSGQVTSGVAQEVTTLQGATERIQDAVVMVQGPVTNPRVTDQATGAYVELLGALTAADYWRVNVGTWASRVGTALTLGSADTAGTDRQADTRFGGTRSAAAFLPMVPVRDTGARRVKIALSGTGITTATRVHVRARRKYAL